MLKNIILPFILLSASAQANQLFVEDTETLLKIENQGYEFAEQNKQAYETVLSKLTKDILTLQAPGTGPSMAYSKRLFDINWLRSPKSKFELAGIIFRPDRMFRHPGDCGEVRLIYRLAYQDDKTATYSRLPMTIQQIRVIKKPCTELYKIWDPKNVDAILSVLKKSEQFDLELNLQSVRWPAGIKADMGAYAEYIMRAFEKREGKWQAKLLDNTIDVEKINKNPALKKELLSWLKTPAHMDLVDQGEAMLEAKFLTEKASSIAVHGLNRKANRLFSQVFTETDFADLDFSKMIFAKSPKGYLRKLDEMTCIGCHQSKSVAGFHFLGRDRKGSLEFNQVKIPFSYHFWTDQKRRTMVHNSASRFGLGFVDRPPLALGKKNERCYRGRDKSFSHWTCQPGLKCEPIGAAIGDEFFGICQTAGLGMTGEACYFGRITQHSNPMLDKEIQVRLKPCQHSLGCLRPRDGYPGGLCFANYCKSSDSKACAALAVPGFNPCLARRRPFKECLANFTGSIEAENCDLEKPCRDDFICARGFQGKGVCAPPYSLFQLRVDGH